MADYYHDLVTDKSWKTLQELKSQVGFVLIGGWAIYLYTKALKSKDIDIIVNFDQLDRLRSQFEVVKNERLKKYEARREEVQIDVYLPHFSEIGVPIEEVVKRVVSRETFVVPVPEALLILKQFILGQRGLSAKGQKDRLDILSILLSVEVNFREYRKLTQAWGLTSFPSELAELVSTTVRIPELSVDEYQWSKVKKKVLNLVA